MSSLETKENLSLLSLPDELLFSCLARVSRLYYPTLSLVSKRFRSLIASPELYKARSLLGQTECCLYVCIRFFREDKDRWFTLCRKPDHHHQSLTNDTTKSTEYYLVAIPVSLYPPAQRLALVAVGSNIYNFSESSDVSILDCTTHTWREGPNLGENMSMYPATVVDQKIYVAGRCKNGDSYTNVVKVFDTKSGSFDHVPIPCREIQGEFFLCCACIDGKYHVKNGNMVAYNSKEGRWDPVEVVGKYRYIGSYFEMENVLYSGYNGDFRWYDSKENMWRELKGLVGVLPQFTSYSRVKLVDYGGKMMVFWENDRIVGVVKEKMIWCAVFMLERRNGCEIWGKIEWLDCVLVVTYCCDVVQVLVVSV